MKVTEHVEHLLREGKKPKELLALGFPKQVITKVRRQLKEEKAPQPVKVPKVGGVAKVGLELLSDPGADAAAMLQKLASLESGFNRLEGRIRLLEVAHTEKVSLVDLEARLDGTPGLGLKHRFKCDCGASGLVALHIQCTKCGKETWWGWFPKQ